MAHYTLFEHETTRGFEPTERERLVLARLNKATGAELLTPVVRGSGIELKAAQYTGVVRLARRTIQILPKIYAPTPGSSREQHASEATRNLLYLLSYAGQLTVREQEIAPLLRQGRDWFEILTNLFASNLLKEWRLGAFRSYQNIDAELPLLKGKWRIGEQLRHPQRHHRFAVSYDEFTADNALNRVFRFVTERLYLLTRDAENRQLLATVRQWMGEDVALRSAVTLSDAAAIVLTRQNNRYAPLLHLARLFLSGGSLQIASGDLSTFAFVFDMNQLFEAFIFHFIRRHQEEVLPPSLLSCDLLSQSKGTGRYLARRDDNSRVLHLKPDIAFKQGESFPLLLDTKYKRLKPSHRQLGISPADIYQMHAYAHRFGCPRVLLLYPQTSETGAIPLTRFALEGSGGKVVAAATVNLQVQLSAPAERQTLCHSIRELLQQFVTPTQVECVIPI